MACTSCGGSIKTPYSPRYAKETGTLTFSALGGDKSVNVHKESYLLEEHFLKNEITNDYRAQKKYQRDNFVFKSELFKANPDLNQAANNKAKTQSAFAKVEKENPGDNLKEKKEVKEETQFERSQVVKKLYKSNPRAFLKSLEVL